MEGFFNFFGLFRVIMANPVDLLGSFILLAYVVLVEHSQGFFVGPMDRCLQLNGKLQTASWFDSDGSPIFSDISCLRQPGSGQCQRPKRKRIWNCQGRRLIYDMSDKSWSWSCPRHPDHPVIFSADDWGVQSPSQHNIWVPLPVLFSEGDWIPRVEKRLRMCT